MWSRCRCRISTAWNCIRTTSRADISDVTAYAAANGHKILAAGDQERLGAVEGGGGLMLLAGRPGYVQLAASNIACSCDAAGAEINAQAR